MTLTARNGHAALARRIDQLEVVLQATSEEDEQERFLRAFWQGLPQIVRCLLDTAAAGNGPADYSRLTQLVGVVVKVAFDSEASESARWQALGATVLHQAHWALTCRLMREHGSNTWSYGCEERREAAEILFALSVGEMAELDDAALVSAWAERFSLRSENSDVLEPAALAVLAVATKQLELFLAVDCAHEDGHPVPLGKAYIALESVLWSRFWSPS